MTQRRANLYLAALCFVLGAWVMAWFLFSFGFASVDGLWGHLT